MLFGEEFHTLGHIFLCIENVGGLQVRNGHIELSVALAKLANIVFILVRQNPFY
jgi:3,4-dihydroxy-2-butanone 4-phosphate synthase